MMDILDSWGLVKGDTNREYCAFFSIGRQVIQLESDSGSAGFYIDPAYLPFRVPEQKPDLLLVEKAGGIPDRDAELIFTSGGPWNIRLDEDGLIISVFAGSPPKTYLSCSVDLTISRGTLYASKDFAAYPDYFPFTYPLDELLIINRLSQGVGLEMHACGIDDHGHGLLFSGISGAGKSTLSRLWAEAGATVLSDDRIIITQDKGRYWIHGTPWHGEAGLASASSAPLEAIFFLNQAAENRAWVMPPEISAANVIARSFPTYWSQEGMQATADLAACLCEEIDAFSLDFLPQASIIDYVRRL